MYELEALQAIKEEKSLENVDEIDPGAVVTFDGYDTTVMTHLLRYNRMEDITTLVDIACNKSPEKISKIFDVDLGDDSTPLTNFASCILHPGGDWFISPWKYKDLICLLIQKGVDVERLQKFLIREMKESIDSSCDAACQMLEVIDRCLTDESKKTHPYDIQAKLQELEAQSYESQSSEDVSDFHIQALNIENCHPLYLTKAAVVIGHTDMPMISF